MVIKYFGHACFLIELSNKTRLIFDPFGDIGYKMQRATADIALISHNHYDHNNVNVVDGIKVVVHDADYIKNGLSIKSIKTYHDEMQGALRGENYVHIVDFDGKKIAHLGDFGEDVSLTDLSIIDGVDVLFLPVGGKYTIDAVSAKKVVDIVKPKLVIPMHFKTPSSTVDVASVQNFTKLFDDALITTLSTDSLVIDKDINYDSNIIVFDYKNF
jgi:L-ascorbate metabolism protein UlaG (beta-lactamase superfamily)